MKASKLVFTLLSSFLLFACDSKKEEEPIEDVIIPTEHDYKEVKQYELTLETMFDVGSDSYYCYFYSPSCSHCVELKDFIITQALDRGDIYFIKSSSKDQFTTDRNLVINAENPGDIWILGYPTMLKIDEKKVSKNLVGNDEIIQELK